jgi:hypothetical protein
MKKLLAEVIAEELTTPGARRFAVERLAQEELHIVGSALLLNLS